MKKIYTGNDVVEAHRIVDVLTQKNIEASFQQENMALPLETGQRIHIYIHHDYDYPKAMELIAQLNGDSRNILPKNSNNTVKYVTMVVLFIIFSGMIFGAWDLLSKTKNSVKQPTEWDKNADGQIDVWTVYDGKKFVMHKMDTDFDGQPDRWIHYNVGLITLDEFDRNRDGKVDMQVYYDNNRLKSYTADNDWDGQIDNWGTYKNGLISEYNISYLNDDIADKHVECEKGRKISEEYDRDRDGQFDETIFYDEFERVIRKE